MSDPVVAPEKLTAWQRWELPNFESQAAPRPAEGLPQLPTADQIENIYQQSREEGYQVGYADGIQKAVQENQRLAELLSASEQQIDEQVAQELLALALALTRQILRQALQIKPELLLAVVRDAIATLPHLNQGAHLVLHPEDAALVRARMGEQLAHSGWKIFEDTQIERGGARIETVNTQIDATLESRWHQVLATLGQDTTWMVKE